MALLCSFTAGTQKEGVHWFHVVLKRACDGVGAGGHSPRYTAHLLDPARITSFKPEDRGGDIYRKLKKWCKVAGVEVEQGRDDWEAAYREAIGTERAPPKQEDNQSCGWYAILAVAHAAGKHTNITTIHEVQRELFKEELAARKEELAARSGLEAADNDSDSSDGLELVRWHGCMQGTSGAAAGTPWPAWLAAATPVRPRLAWPARFVPLPPAMRALGGRPCLPCPACRLVYAPRGAAAELRPASAGVHSAG